MRKPSRIPLELTHQQLEPSRLELYVVVDHRDVAAAAGGDAECGGTRETSRCPRGDDVDTRPVSPEIGEHSGIAAVNNDRDLLALVGLLRQRAQQSRQELQAAP